MSLPVPPRDCGYDHDHAVALARRDGVTDDEFAEAAAYGRLLDAHRAWGLPFNGYCNAAGYGYVQEPTFAVAQDGWNAYEAFSRLSRGAQTAVVYESLTAGHDVDHESARQFLKHERGVIIHANQPY